MSGHSKWATIKRQKGTADAKRGQLFTKLANAIVIAVKNAGGNADPDTNFKLRLSIDKARSYNMPKDNIERAISKAKGEGGNGKLEEALYEGFGPGGVAIMVETVTDNKQRTVSEVKNVIEKNGGTLGNQGSVSYLFHRVGEIIATTNDLTPDDLLELALEVDCDDFIEEDNDTIFYVDPKNLYSAKKRIEEKGLIVNSAELVYKPLSSLIIDEEQKEKLHSFLGKLEDLSDVQNVFVNTLL